MILWSADFQDSVLQIPTDYIPHFDVTHTCDSQAVIVFFL